MRGLSGDLGLPAVGGGALPPVAGQQSQQCSAEANPDWEREKEADKAQGFNALWLRYYVQHNEGEGMNRYILVDAASEKKKDSDYTAMVVIGLGADGNYYVLDMIRDRLRLTERAEAIFVLHRRWKPKAVGYEKYGMMSDILTRSGCDSQGPSGAAHPPRGQSDLLGGLRRPSAQRRQALAPSVRLR
jgi:hypothetical protein